MKTTSKYSVKNYECTECGHQSRQGTNHYGQIYIKCSKCGWKKPMVFQMVHKCLDPLPEGMGIPEPWKSVKLGDVVEIVTLKKE
jgi:DNA-directed RNA polymerase subunit RPC12/RpoP